MTKPTYQRTIPDNADTDADIKYREVVQRFDEDHLVMTKLINELSMSVNQEDKPILSIVQILLRDLSRTEDIGMVFNLQSRLCKVMTSKVDDKIHDIDSRLLELEQKNTFKYLFGKVKIVEETVRSVLYLGAAYAAVKVMIIPGLGQ